ncbi:MAG: hypothetical protein Ct9H300mP22_7650 [Gammaproteobacteria bacterium]|nr:MAG: hypothetical protein Ct9H300mP22_7650 [Gammaproteobacteria bacterium]
MTKTGANSIFKHWRLYLVLFALFLGVVAIAWKVSVLHITDRDFLQGQGDARTKFEQFLWLLTGD